jgi:hypothetical protein
MVEHRTGTAVGTTERGQSVYDFSIGVSLFLVVVLGALLFVPGAFASANSDAATGAKDVAADRAADRLADSLLAADSGRLSLDCTLALFEDTASCGFDSGNEVADDLALSDRWAANVTIEAYEPTQSKRTVQCWDSTASTLERVGNCPAGEPRLTVGSKAQNNQNFAIAKRVARLNGDRVVIVVRVW